MVLTIEKGAAMKPSLSPIIVIPLVLGISLSTSVISAVLTPYVDRFEAVAQDASIPGIPTVYNSWGSHQTRITQHSDGSIRLLYLNTDATGKNVAWHLMLRNLSGQWSQEASGISTDDVTLMRDARNDRAYVLSWPNSVPTIYSSPGYNGSVIPGNWQNLPSSRHYGNSGISKDGTICLKASHEFATKPYTSVTNTEYACGSFSDTSQTWSWSDYVSRYIGLRYAYDYIFPNPEGLAQGMYATSSSDLYKDASDFPNLDPNYGTYVFDGIRVYASSLNTDATWLNTDSKIPATSSLTSSGVVLAPYMRVHESLVDSKGRIFTNYYADNPYDTSVRSMYVSVANASGSVLFQSKWTAVPTFGTTRLIEDSQNRLWLLWTGQGSSATQVWLYPIIESSSGGNISFTTGKYTDLSAAFNPYSIQGSLFVAAPRGGNDKSLYIDAIYNTCWTTYQANTNFSNSQCYNSDNSGHQRVFYARIRLPD